MKIQLRQISATASLAVLGRHEVIVDRPVEKGGSDAGPMGGQLFLASVGGCFLSTLLAAIRARGAAISGVNVEVVGIHADPPTRFAGIELHVSADAEDRVLFERLVGLADQGCVMMNTLRGALDLKIAIQG